MKNYLEYILSLIGGMTIGYSIFKVFDLGGNPIIGVISILIMIAIMIFAIIMMAENDKLQSKYAELVESNFDLIDNNRLLELDVIDLEREIELLRSNDVIIDGGNIDKKKKS